MDLKNLYDQNGQSIWLDFIRRDLLQSGEFGRLVADGIRGVTTNPSIFEKAIDSGDIYKQDLASYRLGASAPEVYEHLAVADIKAAADALMPLYKSSKGRDGFVSMEVAPTLARDAQATVAEGLRLKEEVGHENLMIKVPATSEGMLAIRALLGHGVHVNVTLLFSRAVCHQVAVAHAAGLEDFVAAGGDVSKVASVASLFVSRMDVMVSPLLQAAAQTAPESKRAAILALSGKVALANAKLAYQDWKERVQSLRWTALA
ncbi:MAG: transaldolase family protein, partial [bacterium]